MPAPVPCAACATGRAPKVTGETVLVTGPPCAGKTSYVADHANPGDLVIDFDLLAQAVGSPNTHGHPDPLKPFIWDAVDAMVNRLAGGNHDLTHAWVIKCAPNPADRFQLAERTGARIVVLETPADECKRRAAETGRPENWGALIDDWWTQYGRDLPAGPTPSTDVEIVVPEPRDEAPTTNERAVMADETPMEPYGRIPAGQDPPRDGDDDTETEPDGDEMTAIRAALKKANKEAETSRRRLKEIEDRDKTEQEKLADKAAGYEAAATAASLKALRFEVALEKGLPKSLAVRLQGQTVEEMNADADELLSTIGTKQKPPSFDGGPRTSAPSSDQDMTSRIRKQLGRT